MDSNALKLALLNPSLSSLTDAQVQATAGFGTPILTPKSDPITYNTLSDVWGFARFKQFLGALQTWAGQSADNAITVASLDKVFTKGIDAANPDVATVGAELITAGLATQTEFNGVFFNQKYLAGSATVTADITAARAAIAFDTQKQALADQGAALWNAWIDQVTAAKDATQFPKSATLPGAQ
jgi:hypothetical protein